MVYCSQKYIFVTNRDTCIYYARKESHKIHKSCKNQKEENLQKKVVTLPTKLT